MTTEYRISLDRDACDGVFACLVRDDRFAEAEDGLATIAGAAGREATADDDSVATYEFDDGRLDDARSAARACPLGAIDVTVAGDE